MESRLFGYLQNYRKYMDSFVPSSLSETFWLFIKKIKNCNFNIFYNHYVTSFNMSGNAVQRTINFGVMV